MSKGARRRKPEPQSEPNEETPAGYLPTANPPRKNGLLLAIAAAALVLWMLALAYLALGSR
jgi:hypothetical protein